MQGRRAEARYEEARCGANLELPGIQQTPLVKAGGRPMGNGTRPSPSLEFLHQLALWLLREHALLSYLGHLRSRGVRARAATASVRSVPDRRAGSP